VELAYAIALFAGWFVAGTLKFVIDSLRTGCLAWDQPGLGGLPGTHTAVVSSTAVLVGLRQGIHTPLFSVAVALAIIVMLDALHVRREVGAHAAALNHVLKDDPLRKRFREAVGHRQVDVRSGLLLGLLCAVALNVVLPYMHRVRCKTHLSCSHPFSRLVSHHVCTAESRSWYPFQKSSSVWA